MHRFSSEFKNLSYVFEKAERILLFAHNRPDPDSVGSNLALKYALEFSGKPVDIACYDDFPGYISPLFPKETFLHPDTINPSTYDVIVGSDSVDRGFHIFREKITHDPVIAVIDHHPNISVAADISILDDEASSASELVYDFFVQSGIPFDTHAASALLMGILFDTGNFQHTNTKPRTFEIGADLVKRGAKLKKITETVFTNRKIGTLRIWGKALLKARMLAENKMIVSALTEQDIKECNASVEEINQAVPLLNNVSDAKFSLLLFQKDPSTIRGSLRSDQEKNIDVSSIAKLFGGGGHKFASGFEIPGRIVETEMGWEVV